MRKKYFIFSDVHGQYIPLLEALKAAGYDSSNPTHQLLSIGDNFDRGPQSREVWNYLRQHNAICVKGNHETFLEEALEKGIDGEYVLFNCLHNGLDKTLQSFAMTRLEGYVDMKYIDDCIKHIDKSLLLWLKKMPYYYETRNYIFVHAGVDPDRYWKDTSQDFMLWDVDHSAIPCNHTDGKTVIFGHHHAFRVREQAKRLGLSTSPMPSSIKVYGNTDEHAPVKIKNKIAIDPCSNYTGKVNVLVLEDEEMPDTRITDETQPEPMDFTINNDGTIAATYPNGQTFTINTDINYATFANDIYRPYV